MGITTRLPAPLGTGARRAREWPGEQPPDEISRGLFGQSRRLMRTHPLATDTLLVAMLLALCSLWLAWSHFASSRSFVVQTALIMVLVVRRRHPSVAFLAASAIALAQWLLGFPLLGDVALLVALYTVAAHESRIRALAAAAVLEAGAAMAAVRWPRAGSARPTTAAASASVITTDRLCETMSCRSLAILVRSAAAAIAACWSRSTSSLRARSSIQAR